MVGKSSKRNLVRCGVVMNNKDIILFGIALLIILLLAIFTPARPDIVTQLPFATLTEGVNVYRVVDMDTTCYVAVGQLHGNTVSIHCVRSECGNL